MTGQSHRAQIRHIVVKTEEIANMVKEIIEMAKGHKNRVQTLMKLASKYSACESKNNGGDLGWLELASDDPRKSGFEPMFKNQELEKIVRENIKTRKMTKDNLFGPVKTDEGYHLLIISNEFGENFHERI